MLKAVGGLADLGAVEVRSQVSTDADIDSTGGRTPPGGHSTDSSPRGVAPSLLSELSISAAVFVPGQTTHTTAAVADLGLVTTIDGLRGVVEQLRGTKVFAVDCEGVDLSRHGRLCLMQLASETGEVYAVDLLEVGGKEGLQESGLTALLESDSILKVWHDCRADCDALLHQMGVHPRGLWDTQVAEILTRRLCGYEVKYVSGCAKLLKSMGVASASCTVEQKQKMHSLFSVDGAVWERRPLPPQLVEYAKSDVAPLLDLRAVLHSGLAELLRMIPSECPNWDPHREADALVQFVSKSWADSVRRAEDCRCSRCSGDSQSAARFDPYVLRSLEKAVRPELAAVICGSDTYGAQYTEPMQMAANTASSCRYGQTDYYPVANHYETYRESHRAAVEPPPGFGCRVAPAAGFRMEGQQMHMVPYWGQGEVFVSV